MDENQLELADGMAEAQRNVGIAMARQAMQQQLDPNFDGMHCIEADCGDEIPQVRLSLGRIRCTRCESRRETRAKLLGIH